MTSRAAQSTYSYGSIALSGNHAAFRVIEGGRAHQGHQSQRQGGTQGQFLVFAVALAMILAIGAYWRHIDISAQARLNELLSNASTEVITVMPGDSLWHIAEAHPVSGCTTQQVVQHILDANDLASPSLTVGMQLEVPQTVVVS